MHSTRTFRLTIAVAAAISIAGGTTTASASRASTDTGAGGTSLLDRPSARSSKPPWDRVAGVDPDAFVCQRGSEIDL